MANTCLVVSLKLVTFLTFLLGACIIITCGWTLAAVFNHDHDAETAQKKEIEKTTPNPNPLQEMKNEISKQVQKSQKQRDPRELDGVNVTTVDGDDEVEQHEAEKTKRRKQIFPKFHKMEGNYKKIVIVCSSVAVIAGFVQMTYSMFTLSSCSQKIKNRLKIWLGLHLLVFLVLLICFTLPLTFHPERGEQLKMEDLLNSVKSRVSKFTGNSTPILEKFTHDLTAFYIVVGLNEVFLFISMISLCICKKCMNTSYEPIR